jgi:hypothetical protein
VTPGLAGFADDRPGAAGTAADGDHTNRQEVIMVVLLALVTELSVPSKDGIKVDAL